MMEHREVPALVQFFPRLNFVFSKGFQNISFNQKLNYLRLETTHALHFWQGRISLIYFTLEKNEACRLCVDGDMVALIFGLFQKKAPNFEKKVKFFTMF